MKTKRNLFLVIGILLVLLNLLLDLVSLNEYTSVNKSYSIGYFLGGHILLFIGLFLLRKAYKINNRLKLAKINSIEQDIEQIGRK